MDGLSVSVVPKERAGMAAGIFGTVRVAGEGLALASVLAVLGVLIEGRLPAASGEVRELAQSATRLATGDLVGAGAVRPFVSTPTLITAYETAFSHLAYGLAGLTVVLAGIVLVALRQDSESLNPIRRP
jgi:hypothetical protein